MDLWPLITEGKAPDRDALLLVGTRPGRAAVRMGDWKLLLGASDAAAETEDDDARPGPPTAQLFDLGDVVGARRDRAAAEPDLVRAMRARLDRLLAGAVPPRAASSS